MVAHPHIEPIVVDSSRRRVVRYQTFAATCCTLSRAISAASRAYPRRRPAYRVLERI